MVSASGAAELRLGLLEAPALRPEQAKNLKTTHVPFAITRPQLLQTISPLINPKGPGCNDQTKLEKCINVVTSLPILLVGLHTLRHRKSMDNRKFGASLATVGCVATLYHATTGPLRVALRKLDYWSIAVSTTLLRSAALPGTKGKLNWACCALTPFKPTWVVGANVALLEMKFGREAMENPSLRKSWAAHLMTGLTGLTSFAVEDKALEAQFPYMHAAWHCLSAASLGTANGLLKHEEELQVEAADATSSSRADSLANHVGKLSLNEGHAHCLQIMARAGP